MQRRLHQMVLPAAVTAGLLGMGFGQTALAAPHPTAPRMVADTVVRAEEGPQQNPFATVPSALPPGHPAGAVPGTGPGKGSIGPSVNAMDTGHNHKAIPYEGGPIQQNPLVYLIFWGPQWNTDAAHISDGNAVISEFQSVIPGATPYTNIHAQYDDGSARIHPPTYGGYVLDTSAPPPNPCEGNGSTNYSTEITAAINYSHWQTGTDVQYVVLTDSWSSDDFWYATGVYPCDTVGSGGGACAYHTYSTQNYVFTVMPDMEDPATGNSCAYGSTPQQDLTIIESHEFSEATTDPYINGWVDTSGGSAGELGDFCNTTPAVDYSGMVLQELYSNETTSCVPSIANPTVPKQNVTDTTMGNGTHEVVNLGSDGRLWYQYWTGLRWWVWTPLSGPSHVTISSFATASMATNNLDIVIRGTNSKVYDIHWNGKSWGKWTDLHLSTAATPSMVSPARGKLTVLVQGGTSKKYRFHNVWSVSLNGSHWSGTSIVASGKDRLTNGAIRGSVTSAPSATSTSNGTITLTALGPGNHLWYKRFNGHTWGAWLRVPGVNTADSAPAAVSYAHNSLAIFYHSAGTVDVVHATNGGRWSAPLSVGGSPTGASIAVSSTSTNTVTITILQSGGLYDEDWTVGGSETGFTLAADRL